MRKERSNGRVIVDLREGNRHPGKIENLIEHLLFLSPKSWRDSH